MQRIARKLFATTMVVTLGFGLSGCSTEEATPVVPAPVVDSNATTGTPPVSTSPDDQTPGNPEKAEMAADAAEYKTSETPK